MPSREPPDLESGDNPPCKPHAQPLRTPFFSRASLLGPVDTSHADIILLAHSLATGIVDAASFSNWAVFAGMQTGNTVLLGLSTAGLTGNPHAWLTTLVSITSYLLGALATFRLSSLIVPGPKSVGENRLYLFALLAVQSLFILVAAGLVAGDVVPHNPPGMATHATAAAVLEDVRIVALLPLLAFQAGVQIATSRLLGFNELPVNVVTSTYCDIMGDKKVLERGNRKRDRRVASVVLVLVGAVVAGWVMRSRAGLEGALFVAGAVKGGAAVGGLVLMKRVEMGKGV
ncbi:hypothetical protein BDZ85DRAFT_316920 [Elsinoe ampelina]|uniref:DUF1275 domain protein n=1 Tax=Elsinoe ampelina TaxID=302913 RepID=A0A6A6GJG3_9PEZI|nr:hypothetical protein BDZ85DRAFT_316920 [Elsinoe ampelina]